MAENDNTQPQTHTRESKDKLIKGWKEDYDRKKEKEAERVRLMEKSFDKVRGHFYSSSDLDRPDRQRDSDPDNGIGDAKTLTVEPVRLEGHPSQETGKKDPSEQIETQVSLDELEREKIEEVKSKVIKIVVQLSDLISDCKQKAQDAEFQSLVDTDSFNSLPFLDKDIVIFEPKSNYSAANEYDSSIISFERLLLAWDEKVKKSKIEYLNEILPVILEFRNDMSRVSEHIEWQRWNVNLKNEELLNRFAEINRSYKDLIKDAEKDSDDLAKKRQNLETSSST